MLALVLLSVLGAPLELRDSIRDVYVDGKLTRSAQTLVSSSPRVVAVVCGEEVLLLDPESMKVSRMPKGALQFTPDRLKATATAAAAPAGEVAKSGTTYIATIEGRSVVVAPHQSKAGAMTEEELWATAPVWRSVADAYLPDAALVERLRKIDRPVKLEIVLATWCGDSRQYVPRLLKSIETANNPNLTVELIGIDADFHQPMDVVAGRNITNVPTVIVSERGRELGRVVETPAAATVEDDVCDIVNGTPHPHRGRIERGALLHSGTYVLRDAQKRPAGTEVFAVYEKPGGGKVAHSVIARPDGTSLEVWATPTFIEITERAARTTRTRYRRHGEAWTALSRGAHGIVEQTVAAPAAFVSPATVTYAWARGAEKVYAARGGAGVVEEFDVRVVGGEVPRVVRLSDGSTRTLGVR